MPHPPAPYVVTGLHGWRDLVLALPCLAALRRQHPDAHITVIAPPCARDLLLRLRLADAVRVTASASVIALLLWVGWWRLYGQMTGRLRVLRAETLTQTVPPAWHNLQRDLSFITPRQPYVLMALPEGWPVLRAAALARKLDLQGHAVVLVGGADAAMCQRLLKAAPDVRDLTGRVDAADLPQLVQGAAAVIGGADGDTALMALAGARTLIVSAREDAQGLAVLPHATTRWLVCDDLTQLGVNEVMGVIDVWV